jgi:hypothetical protein
LPIAGTVRRIQVVFDEDQDAFGGHDFSALLDNIEMNGALVGHGATDTNQVRAQG